MEPAEASEGELGHHLEQERRGSTPGDLDGDRERSQGSSRRRPGDAWAGRRAWGRSPKSQNWNITLRWHVSPLPPFPPRIRGPQPRTPKFPTECKTRRLKHPPPKPLSSKAANEESGRTQGQLAAPAACSRAGVPWEHPGAGAAPAVTAQRGAAESGVRSLCVCFQRIK